jgi:phage gp16-like protein
MHRKPAPEKEAVIRKIEAILADMELPWSYADGIARKMFGVEKLLWCDADQTFRVLQALAVYQRRHGGAKS